MSKRYRFFILLIVLGVCFLFLLPSIRWYFFVPRDQQTLALGSRQQIRTDSSQAAGEDYQRLLDIAIED
jgi:preprotein translocase subunit SecD